MSGVRESVDFVSGFRLGFFVFMIKYKKKQTLGIFNKKVILSLSAIKRDIKMCSELWIYF